MSLGLALGGVVGEGGADFVDLGAVGPDCLVKDLAGDVEFLGPVGDVGGDFGVDLRLAAGALGVLFVRGVGLVGFGCVVMLGHAGSSFQWLVGCGWWPAARGVPTPSPLPPYFRSQSISE